MSTAGKRIIQSAKEALAFAKGEANISEYGIHIPEEINVRKIRKKLRMSQKAFAKQFGFNQRTLQDWEQGRYNPTGAARAFLIVIGKETQV